jgi:hypothetical protein
VEYPIDRSVPFARLSRGLFSAVALGVVSPSEVRAVLYLLEKAAAGLAKEGERERAEEEAEEGENLLREASELRLAAGRLRFDLIL